MYAGSPRRLFFNPAETTMTGANVSHLRVKWSFPTGAVVTASPAAVTLDLPGEHRTAVAFVASWDGGLYALRVRDGTLLWRFAMAEQPGAAFPEASSVERSRPSTDARAYSPPAARPSTTSTPDRDEVSGRAIPRSSVTAAARPAATVASVVSYGATASIEDGSTPIDRARRIRGGAQYLAGYRVRGGVPECARKRPIPAHSLRRKPRESPRFSRTG